MLDMSEDRLYDQIRDKKLIDKKITIDRIEMKPKKVRLCTSKDTQTKKAWKKKTVNHLRATEMEYGEESDGNLKQMTIALGFQHSHTKESDGNSMVDKYLLMDSGASITGNPAKRKINRETKEM